MQKRIILCIVIVVSQMLTRCQEFPRLPPSLEVITVSNASQLQLLLSIDEIGSSDTLSFSPTENILASGNINNEVHVFDWFSGKLLFSFDHSGITKSVSFSHDGAYLAVGTQLASVGDLILWDVTTQQRFGMLNGHSGWISGVAFSPDDGTLASASSDGTVRLWNIESQQEIAVLQGHTDWVNSIAFSPDDGTLASASSDGTVRLWNIESQQETAILQGNSRHIGDLAYNSQGTLLASGGDNHTIQLWSIVDDRKLLRELQGHTGAIFSLSFAPGSNVLASIALDNTLHLWDVETGESLIEVSFKNILGMQGVEFSPDGKILAVSISGELQLWGIPE